MIIIWYGINIKEEYVELFLLYKNSFWRTKRQEYL